MAVIAAILFSVLALIIAAFQLALAAGAPWGHLANGGRWPGRLPGGMRILSVLFALIWIALVVLVLNHTGIWSLGITPPLWPALALCVVTTVLNLITPSRPERRLWGPVTLVMTICLAWVVLG